MSTFVKCGCRRAVRRRGTSHSAERHDTAHAGGESTELQSGEQVIALEVGMVLQDLVDRHTRGEELEEVLDGVPEASDGRLTMADGRVRGDPIKPRHPRRRTVPAPREQDHCDALAHDRRAPPSIRPTTDGYGRRWALAGARDGGPGARRGVPPHPP